MHFYQLQRQVQIALQIGGVDDVDDGVRLLPKDKVTCEDLLRRVGTQGINAGQIHNDAVFLPADLAHFSVDCHAREVADMLAGAGQLIEQCGLSAILIAHKRKYHTVCSTSTDLASSRRSDSR